MTTVLELNDAELTLYHDQRIALRSPGIAVLLDNATHFGETALHLSRTHPRQTNAQYFTRLSAEPLPYATRRVRNHADLVYLHLRELAPLIEGELLLAVPAILTPAQLGVLLGILQELDIRVSGFVDSAVAATAGAKAPGTACHVDVMMQRAVITTLGFGDEVSRTGSQEVADCGLARLLEDWVNVTADRFVQETRYDPLHAAASEQQLFNQLHGWIEDHPEQTELALEIHQGDQTRRVELSRSLLAQKAAQRFNQLLDAIPEDCPVFLSARAARLPGLQQTMTQQLRLLQVLPAEAPALGCLNNLPEILRGEGDLRLITRLPHRVAEVLSEQRPQIRPLTPTHALCQDRAVDLLSPRLPFRTNIQGDAALLLADDGLTLNGQSLDRDTALHAGDRVGRGEDEYLIIHVEE